MVIIYKSILDKSLQMKTQSIPNTRRVEVAVDSFALFLAVHLYVPSMCFVVFCTRMTDPFSISVTAITGGSLLSLKLQDNAGFGTPDLTLQLMLVALPSGTIRFLGDTLT